SASASGVVVVSSDVVVVAWGAPAGAVAFAFVASIGAVSFTPGGAVAFAFVASIGAVSFTPGGAVAFAFVASIGAVSFAPGGAVEFAFVASPMSHHSPFTSAV
ncbi:hypothetical protein T484DRAFT_1863433, partial [Baffinella frigidus]